MQGFIYKSPVELGTRLRRFDPARDEKVVFVAVFSQKDSVAVRGVLIRPNYQQHGTFRGELSPRAGAGTWQSKSWWWPMSQLKPYPGEWQLQLWVNEQPMGRYYFFMLGGERKAGAPRGSEV